MKKEYKIEGKFHEDVTDDFMDRILDDFYIWNNGVGRLTEGIKIVEKRIYYLLVDDEHIEELLDERIKEINPEIYGVSLDKTVVDGI